MTEIHFEDGGALLADSRVYIEREADTQANVTCGGWNT